MSAAIADITAAHTGAAPPHPLSLPFPVASKLGRDTNHATKTSLPSLHNLFRDAQGCAADRLAKTLYPEYVKFQLTQCARSSLSTSLASPDFRGAYPGLGAAFCLASPSLPSHPVLFASSALTTLHGPRPLLHHPLLHSLPPGSPATLRLREALALGRETVELVVGDDDTTQSPFWNLFVVCPLRDAATGALRFHLGAQINVSASMGDQPRDVLRVLSFSPVGDDLRTTTAVVVAAPPSDAAHPPPRRRTLAGLFSSRGRERETSPRPMVISAPLRELPPPPSGPAAFTAEEPSAAARSTHTAVLERPFDRSSTPYGSLVVLQLDGGVATTTMRIVFCSALAHEMIAGGGGGGGGGEEVLVGRDVFEALMVGKDAAGERKALGKLRGRVAKGVEEGETVVGEVVVGGMGVVGKGKGKWHGSGAVGTSLFGGEGDKGGRVSGSAERNGFAGGKMRKLVTHWTPLMDGERKVEWVVLVLTPAAARG